MDVPPTVDSEFNPEIDAVNEAGSGLWKVRTRNLGSELKAVRWNLFGRFKM